LKFIGEIDLKATWMDWQIFTLSDDKTTQFILRIYHATNYSMETIIMIIITIYFI